MPVERWPDADRQAWAAALRAGSVLDGRGALAGLAPGTVANHRHAYGRWLTFQERQGLLDPAMDATERATPANVSAWIDELRPQVAPLTLAQWVTSLERALHALGPTRDLGWLRGVARRLSRAARPVRDKRSRIVAVDHVEAVARRLVAEAAAAVGQSLRRRAEKHRDGLMLGLLATRGLRFSNFHGITLDRHLRRVGGGWMLLFEAAETKNRRPLELTVPEPWVEPLEQHLRLWRPVLLKGRTSDQLWISVQAAPFSSGGLRQRIERLTERELGVRLWPHLFRHALATDIAINDPTHVGISSAILGHADPRTVERSYNLASQRGAATRWHRTLLARRRQAERRLRK